MTESDAVITLSAPSATEFVRLCRLTAAAVAADAQFGFDDVEDIRIAVDEACAVLVEPAGSDLFTFRIERADERLLVTGERSADGLAAVAVNPLVETILSAVTDEYAFADEPARSFRLVKRRGG